MFPGARSSFHVPFMRPFRFDCRFQCASSCPLVSPRFTACFCLAGSGAGSRLPVEQGSHARCRCLLAALEHVAVVVVRSLTPASAPTSSRRSRLVLRFGAGASRRCVSARGSGSSSTFSKRCLSASSKSLKSANSGGTDLCGRLKGCRDPISSTTASLKPFSRTFLASSNLSTLSAIGNCSCRWCGGGSSAERREWARVGCLT